jgi:hypothetical protein
VTDEVLPSIRKSGYYSLFTNDKGEHDINCYENVGWMRFFDFINIYNDSLRFETVTSSLAMKGYLTFKDRKKDFEWTVEALEAGLGDYDKGYNRKVINVAKFCQIMGYKIENRVVSLLVKQSD